MAYPECNGVVLYFGVINMDKNCDGGYSAST